MWTNIHTFCKDVKLKNRYKNQATPWANVNSCLGGFGSSCKFYTCQIRSRLYINPQKNIDRIGPGRSLQILFINNCIKIIKNSYYTENKHENNEVNSGIFQNLDTMLPYTHTQAPLLYLHMKTLFVVAEDDARKVVVFSLQINSNSPSDMKSWNNVPPWEQRAGL